MRTFTINTIAGDAQRFCQYLEKDGVCSALPAEMCDSYIVLKSNAVMDKNWHNIQHFCRTSCKNVMYLGPYELHRQFVQLK